MPDKESNAEVRSFDGEIEGRRSRSMMVILLLAGASAFVPPPPVAQTASNWNITLQVFEGTLQARAPR